MAGGLSTRVFERRELVDEMTVALKAQKEVGNEGEKWYKMKCTPCDAVEGSFRIQVALGGAGNGRSVDIKML